MNKAGLGTAVTLVGLLLLMLSWLGVGVAAPERAWPPEKAEQFEKLGARYHALQHQKGALDRRRASHQGPPSSEDPAKLRAEYEQVRREWDW